MAPRQAVGGQPRTAVPPTTTIKISRHVAGHIARRAKPSESVDQTLRRLLGVAREPAKEQGPVPPATTIKISRKIMDFLTKRCRPGESRDDTLRRLLSLRRQDGNVKERP